MGPISSLCTWPFLIHWSQSSPAPGGHIPQVSVYPLHCGQSSFLQTFLRARVNWASQVLEYRNRVCSLYKYALIFKIRNPCHVSPEPLNGLARPCCYPYSPPVLLISFFIILNTRNIYLTSGKWMLSI